MAAGTNDRLDKGFFGLTPDDRNNTPYGALRNAVLGDLLRTKDYAAGVAAIERHIGSRDRGLLARIFSIAEFSGYQQHVEKNLDAHGIEKPLLVLHRITQNRKLSLDDVLAEAYSCSSDDAMIATVVLSYEMKYFDMPHRVKVQDENAPPEENLLFEREHRVYADAKVAEAALCLQKAKAAQLTSENALEQMTFLLHKLPILYAHVSGLLDLKRYTDARERLERAVEEITSFTKPRKPSIVPIDGTLYYFMARAFLGENNTTEAVRYFQAAITSSEQTFSERKQYVDGHRIISDSYLGIVETLLQKNEGRPQEGEREYAFYALFKLRECGAEGSIIALGNRYLTEGRHPDAEFVLAKLVQEGTENPVAYTQLASAVRAQNTGSNYREEREQWARWLDWKVTTLPKRES